jgi:hypothetical protein
MINHTTFIGVRNRSDITLVSLGQQKLRGRAELSEVYSVAFEPAAPLAPPGPRRDPRQERPRGPESPEVRGFTRLS